MTYKSLKMIAVSEENYSALRNRGHFGDSFDDVITELLKEINMLKAELSRSSSSSVPSVAF
jgi:predicted CopG family antitoxin